MTGVFEIICTIVVAASIVGILSEATADFGTLLAVAVVALLFGLGLGIQYQHRWLTPTLIAGSLTSVFLFIRGQAFLFQGAPISYPLLFGLQGAMAAVGVTLLSGWVGSRLAIAQRFSSVHLPPFVRVGLVVAAGWTGIEFLFGLGVGSTVGTLLDNTFVGVLTATIIGFPVATAFAIRYGRRHEITRSDWDYETDARTLVAGLLAGFLTTLVVYGLGFVTAAIGGTETTLAAFGFLLTDLEAGLWVVALFAVAHGLIAPVTEEIAWRGIVQTALVRSRGVAAGLVITALLFTAKHAILDASVARVPTVLVLSLVLGIVRYRWGTAASTVVHIVVNLTSVGILAVIVLS